MLKVAYVCAERTLCFTRKDTIVLMINILRTKI